MPSPDWRQSFKALSLVLIAAVVLLLFSRLLATQAWLSLYQNRFEFTPGSWFASRMADARRDPQRTCVIVGASTAREGFSGTTFDQALPDIKVVNLGTTGGKSAIDIIEIQARALASLGDRYKCIMVGLHPVFLTSFDSSMYELVKTDYTAILSLSDIFDLARPPWRFPNRGPLIRTYLMPLGQHAPFLNRLVRDWLFQAHLFAIDAHAARKDFERRDGELEPGLQYSYFGSVLKEKQETFREKARFLDWDKAATFGGPREVAALHHALRLLRPLTDRLIVVDMPESFLFDDIDRLARAPFEAAIRSSNVEMTEITCSVPDGRHQREFYDEIHLNEIGRERLTRSISKLLSDIPLSRAIDPDEPCAVRVR